MDQNNQSLSGLSASKIKNNNKKKPKPTGCEIADTRAKSLLGTQSEGEKLPGPGKRMT